MNELSENPGQLREALDWYEHMAKQMQRATLQLDNQVMLHLMKELALDGGNRARRAIESVSANYN